MDYQTVQFEVSVGEMREFMAKVVGCLSSIVANHRPVGPFITVEERCRQRRLVASKKFRYRVRDVVKAIHLERLGRPPYKLTGNRNGTFVIEQEHLALLDEAIDKVLEEPEWQDRQPLFRASDR